MADERYVDLTDDQFTRLVEDRRTIEHMAYLLSDMAVHLAEDAARRDTAFWRNVDQICDKQPDEKVSVLWPARQIRISKIES